MGGAGCPRLGATPPTRVRGARLPPPQKAGGSSGRPPPPPCSFATRISARGALVAAALAAVAAGAAAQDGTSDELLQIRQAVGGGRQLRFYGMTSLEFFEYLGFLIWSIPGELISYMSA